ncbi:MAG TPA: hypothetical protein VK154_08360 [Chitinophagales bacterium]|nr:hypothetical protein [Chitinophagales bacterium]
MEKILPSILVFLSSIVKFAMGSLAAIAANLGLGGSLANIIGGIIGIVLFTYLGSYMQEFLVRKFPNRFGRRFTSSNRFLVKVKQKFGLGGIAALTPIVLSIPVGVLFALALTHDKKKILVSMLASMFFWATVLFLPYFLFNINVVDLIKNLFER